MRDRLRAFGTDAVAALGHIVAAVALLWQSIRPGRTLVPADILTAVTPYRGLAGGVDAHNPVLSDATIQFFPWFRFLGRALRDGGLPEWNPLILGGVPVTPNGFVSVWYPPFWLPRWLRAFDAYDAFVVGHLAFGAIGVYAFTRCLGAGRAAAWLAGAMALVGGMWVHWSLHLLHLVAMVWLPWGLAATHRLVERPSAGRTAALAVALGLWWLGANPQYAYYGSLTIGVYALARVVQRRAWSAIAWFGVGVVLGALLAAPVLLPSAGVGDEILRGREPVRATAGNHLPFHELARVVVPDATGNTADGVKWRSRDEYRLDSPFVGVAALVLVGAGVAAGRHRARWTLLAVAVGALTLAATGLPHHVLHAALPGYDRFRGAARWVAVLPAVALPLAGLGVDALLRRDRRARTGALVVGVAAVVVVLVWWLWERSEPAAPHDYLAVRLVIAVSIVAVVVVAAWAATRWPRAAVAAVTACVAFELAFSTPRWFPSVEERTAYPSVAVGRLAGERGGRLLRAGTTRGFVSTFSADIPMVHGLADAQGQTVLFPKDVDRYLRLVDDHGDFAHDTNVAPDIVRTSRLTSPLLDAYDVRTVLAESNVAVPRALPVVDDTTEPRVYANPGARPATLVELAVPASGEEMWEAIARPGWDPTATAAVVGLAEEVGGSGGRVVGGRTGTDGERWVVESPSGGFLRVAARFHEGWSARVDGEPARVHRADGIFRGVVVPPGRHVVTFRYRNEDERTGGLVALGAAGALVGLAVAGRFRPRRNGPDGS